MIKLTSSAVIKKKPLQTIFIIFLKPCGSLLRHCCASPLQLHCVKGVRKETAVCVRARPVCECERFK